MSQVWDGGTEFLQNTCGTVSLLGAILKIKENRVIVNAYLQELCYLVSYELMMHNSQVYSVCRFIVFVWGPTLVTETVRLIVLLVYSYTICCFGDLNFTNKNQKVIRVWIIINTIHVMFYGLYYAVYNMNNRISVPKYWNIFFFL